MALHHLHRLYDTWVMGRSFRMAFTSTARVWSSVRVIKALLSVFLMARLDSPIRRSQNPPYHGALLGINSLSAEEFLS